MSVTLQPIGFVATTDAEAALAFYERVLGLGLVERSPFALVFDDGGVMLRVQIVASLTPAAHTVHGWQVVDMEREVEHLASKGLEFLRFEGMDQDAQGIWTTPDGNRIAWFKDPDGNILSLTAFDAAGGAQGQN